MIMNMGSVVEDFIQTPSVELLEQCTKYKLLKIAEHFGVKVSDKRLKENIKNFSEKLIGR